MFRQVTDMAWNAAGDTFISDGYINSRVAKYDKNGKWIKSFGEPGSGPGQLNTPHSIATDNQGNVYVANRGNSRIEVFDGDGKYLRQIKISEPFDYASTVPIIGNKPPVDLVEEPWATGRPGRSALRRDRIRCCTLRMLFRDASTKSAWMARFLASWVKPAGSSSNSGGFTKLRLARRKNEIYVGELLNWRTTAEAFAAPGEVSSRTNGKSQGETQRTLRSTEGHGEIQERRAGYDVTSFGNPPPAFLGVLCALCVKAFDFYGYK